MFAIQNSEKPLKKQLFIIGMAVLLICVVISGCIENNLSDTAPSYDASCESLLPEDVNGLNFIESETSPGFIFINGAVDSAVGRYTDNYGNKLEMTIFKFKEVTDAENYAVFQDIMLQNWTLHFENLSDFMTDAISSYISFTREHFVFCVTAIQNASANDVEKLARATGYYP